MTTSRAACCVTRERHRAGHSARTLPILFDKFYRVENNKRVAKGTGLGLELVKHIVETVHHGQICVESKLGMGFEVLVQRSDALRGFSAAA